MIAQRRRIFRAALQADDRFRRLKRQTLAPKLAQGMVATGDLVNAAKRSTGEKLGVSGGLAGAGGARPVRHGWEGRWQIG